MRRGTTKRRRQVLLLCVMLFVLVASRHHARAQIDLESVNLQAEAAYLSGDYQSATMLYTTLIESGVQTGPVYFNLGNAYYESSDVGQALVNFRRALEHAPRDIEVNTHIALIRSRRLDLQDDESALIDSAAALTTTTFRTVELGWISLVFWGIWFSVASAATVRPKWRGNLIVPMIVFGILMLSTVGLYGARLYTNRYRPLAVVIEEVAPVLTGPDDERYLQIFELHTAAEVRILEEHDRWARFVLPDGRQGWIPQDSIELV